MSRFELSVGGTEIKYEGVVERVLGCVVAAIGKQSLRVPGHRGERVPSSWRRPVLPRQRVPFHRVCPFDNTGKRTRDTHTTTHDRMAHTTTQGTKVEGDKAVEGAERVPSAVQDEFVVDMVRAVPSPLYVLHDRLVGQRPILITACCWAINPVRPLFCRVCRASVG